MKTCANGEHKRIEVTCLDCIDTLRAEVAAQREVSIKVAEAIDAVHAVNDDLVKERDAALLQVEEYRKVIERFARGDSELHDVGAHRRIARLALAQKPLPVEGKPGEVCGPCGVAHPVVEKRVEPAPKCDCMGKWTGVAAGHTSGCAANLG